MEVANYHYGVSDWSFHWKMTVLAAAWVVVSIVCDWLVDRPRLALPARLIWGAFDSLFLLAALLFIAGGVTSGLIAVYPLLIAASALWLDVRFVGVMTGLSLASYGILVVDFYFWRTQLQMQFDASPTRHVVFAVSLVVLAAIVSWLVQRLRTLSKFYGRQLP